MASKVRSFNAKGGATAYVRRAGVAKTPMGRLDPTTGYIWQKPRKTANEIKGSSVRVTNAKASTSPAQNSMTASLGMGGVGQRGINRDVGTAKAKGEV
jgi:hypothetical protein